MNSMDVLVNIAEKLGPTIIAIAAIIVTFVTVKRQIRATTISTSRQRWIDSLQDVLSTLLPVQVGLALGLKVREKPDILRALDEFGTLTTRLKLMLDPAKRDHAELLTVVEELQPILFAKEPNSKEYAPAREKVIAAARKVIDNEWSKIKRGQ